MTSSLAVFAGFIGRIGNETTAGHDKLPAKVTAWMVRFEACGGGWLCVPSDHARHEHVFRSSKSAPVEHLVIYVGNLTNAGEGGCVFCSGLDLILGSRHLAALEGRPRA